MTAMANLGSLWNSSQAWLFPMLEDGLANSMRNIADLYPPSVSFARRRHTSRKFKKR